MSGMDEFPLCWEKDLTDVTDIHLTKYVSGDMAVKMRKQGAISAPEWSHAEVQALWQWCMWNGGLLQRDLRQPQHAMIRWTFPACAMRLSYAPTTLGARLVVRLQHAYGRIPHYEGSIDVGVPGLTIIYGITGTGKTTCAYQWLDKLSDRYIIVSIEDPPECLSNLWAQFDRAIFQDEVSIHHLVLRQNPDVLFWGELRDNVAWKCIENWVTTGMHIVTTLHAYHERQCLDRLKILGADPLFLKRYIKKLYRMMHKH